MDMPKDVQPQWLNFIRRLQSVAKSGGLQVLHCTVLVDAEGRPLVWIEPRVQKVEPKVVDLLGVLSRIEKDGN